MISQTKERKPHKKKSHQNLHLYKESDLKKGKPHQQHVKSHDLEIFYHYISNKPNPTQKQSIRKISLDLQNFHQITKDIILNRAKPIRSIEFPNDPLDSSGKNRIRNKNRIRFSYSSAAHRTNRTF